MSVFKNIGSKFIFFLLAGLFAATASAVNEKTITWLSPDSDVGNKHIVMYNLFGGGSDDPQVCLGCHIPGLNSNLPVTGAKGPPFLSFFGVNMQSKKDGGRACISCHTDGIFLWAMTDDPEGGKGGMSNLRCENCHEVSKRRTENKNANN